MVLHLQGQIIQTIRPFQHPLRISEVALDVAAVAEILSIEEEFAEDGEPLTIDLTCFDVSVVRRLDLDGICRAKVVSLNAERNADLTAARTIEGRNG